MKEIGGFPVFTGKSSKKAKDLTGQRFNRLTVITRGENICNHPAWICKCDCGNYTLVSTQCLLRGTTKSCGCWRKEMPGLKQRLDIANKRFGKLTALSIDWEQTRRERCTWWRCKCDCGTELSVSLNHLTRGLTGSCGCENKSLGERKIAQILTANHIKFIEQYTFADLKGKTGLPYRYDFFLPDYNLLIEYDGIQHYKEVKYFNISLKEQQKRDKIKDKYAKDHHIKLIRIPYTKYNSLTIEDILKI